MGAGGSAGITNRWSGTRHGAYTVELRWDCESLASASTVCVDLYAFHPKSVCAAETPLEAIRTDLRARARFALPLVPSGDDDAVEAAIFEARRAVDENIPESEETLRRAVAVVGEFLRVRSFRDARALALVGTLVADDDDLAETTAVRELESVDQILSEFRVVLAAAAQLELLADIADGARDYLTHAYTRYLAAMGATARKRENVAGLPRLRARLRSLRTAEAVRRSVWGMPSVWRSDDGERQLHKLSQLKKYFQGAIYADVDRRNSSSRLREPVAVIAAALGATVALFAQRYIFAASGEAVGSAIWMAPAVLVFGYVLRDRLKDRSKELLERTAQKLWSSVDERLFLGDKPVGKQRDRLRWTSTKALPPEVAKLRGKGYATPLEAKVPEDILHWRLEQSFYPERAAVAKFGRRWSLRTSLRINLERHLRHLDEPFKTLWSMDTGGGTSEARCRRTYAIYLAVVARRTVESRKARAVAAGAPEPTLFRVLVDRRGVRAIELVADRPRCRLTSAPAELRGPSVLPRAVDSDSR